MDMVTYTNLITNGTATTKVRIYGSGATAEQALLPRRPG
jgi:hypothetical protein